MKPTPKKPEDKTIFLFEEPKDWANWLEENHASSSGLWLKIAKKSTALTSVSYAEALDVALCYGWIDSQKKSCDTDTWLQRFSPRGPKSIWSKINRVKVQALIDSGQMKPAGLLAVERARQDGRWDAAYDPQSETKLPEDLQAALDANPQAKAFFETLNSANRYAVVFRVQTAKKPETRARWVEKLIKMLEMNEKLHP